MVSSKSLNIIPNELSYVDVAHGVIISYSDKHLYFTGDICNLSGHFLSMILGKIDNKGEDRIFFHFNTNGGSIDDAFRIYDTIRLMQTKVTCIIEGQVCSAGTLIMCACDKIWCTKNSYIMIHEYSAEQEGKASELAIQKELGDKLYERMIEIYHERTGHKKVTKQWLKEDRYLNAKEALSMKLIDKII